MLFHHVCIFFRKLVVLASVEISIGFAKLPCHCDGLVTRKLGKPLLVARFRGGWLLLLSQDEICSFQSFMKLNQSKPDYFQLCG